MSEKLRVTTFNVENLFNRYAALNAPFDGSAYEKWVLAVGVASVASRKGDLVAEETTLIQRNNTALAIEGAAPHILAVQEVENVYTLRNFNHDFLGDYFEEIVLVDGNDPRSIDVALLVKRGLGARVAGIRTHIDDRKSPSAPVVRRTQSNGYFAQNAVFSRDCLEVDLDVGGESLTFLVNHLKAQDGTEASERRRERQAQRVAEIVDDVRARGRKPIVLGDLNVDSTKSRSIDALVNHAALKDTLDAVPDSERWTHFFDSKKSVSRLDYVLVDQSLGVVGAEIFRKGLSTKCKQFTGERFATIGPLYTEASDHCPLTVVLDLDVAVAAPDAPSPVEAR